MGTGEYINILEKVRRLSPKTIRSLLSIIDSELKELHDGICSCTIDIKQENVIYISNLISGVEKKDILKKLSLSENDNYKWEIVNGESFGKKRKGSLSAVKIPLYNENDCFGKCSLFISNLREGEFNDIETRALSELLSILILPFKGAENQIDAGSESNLLRNELYEGLKDGEVMRSALKRMMDLSGAEYCAFYSSEKLCRMNIMIDGRELSSQIPDIKKKVINAYGMFNNSSSESLEYSEKIYYRAGKINLKYLIGKISIKSYLIVPVISDSLVNGIVFCGSFRKDAFRKSEISLFSGFWEGGREVQPIIYRVSDEADGLKKFIESIPFGVLLIAENGEIYSENSNFRKILKIDNNDCRTVKELSMITGFDFQYIYDEFKIFKSEISNRKIASAKSFDNILRVNWIPAETVSKEYNSMLFIEKAEEEDVFDDEMLAVVAHEIRTPISALKNSLVIMRDENAGLDKNASENANTASSRKFFDTAIHTINRLNPLLDGLVDISSDNIRNNSLNIERIEARSFVESVSRIFLKPAEKKGINFITDIKKDVSDIEIDLHKAEQIVQNLLSNCLKNVPAGRRIELSVSSTEPPQDTICGVLPWDRIFDPKIIDINVTDSGDGFSPDIIRSVNDSPGEYLPHGRRKFGLGLYIAGELARLHSGLLRIENNEYNGGTCHVYLPADWKTRSVLKIVFDIDDKIKEMVKKGLTPILYLISKESTKCWLNIIDRWNTQPFVDPHSSELLDTGVYFWPLWEKFALVLAMDRTYLSDPEGLFSSGKMGLRLLKGDWDEQLSVGWGISLRDGENTKDLITSAMKKLETRGRVPV